LKTKDFSYDLPYDLIAQSPLDRRDASRLMLLDRKTGAVSHRIFTDLPGFLKPGDAIVLNDSRVLPARLLGRRTDTGGAVEVLLLRDLGGGEWECLTRPGKKTLPGANLEFGAGELHAVVLREQDGGNRIIRFEYAGIFLEVIERLGRMPVPPYIKAELQDPERYQTVYSRETGSVAAPTAGLHFTKELLSIIEERGVHICPITLHVGLGTFRPVKTEDVTDHKMHSEYCRITESTAETLNSVRRSGGRIIAVGTTSCRTLESYAGQDGFFRPASGFVDIFIYPGYRFKAIDGLLTNFHLPESTLIMLVSALAGRENVLRAYAEAVKERYRFFSFGDAMLIL
jgi:S-adenosylmethionine:tRNA ribosyltransferase-isomerase